MYQTVELNCTVYCSMVRKLELVTATVEEAATDEENMLCNRQLHTSDSDAEEQHIQ